METNVQTDKKSKKSKKHEAEAVTGEVRANEEVAAGEADAAVEKAKGAPRPRRWDYGITDEATIERVAENPPVRKDIAEAWVLTEGKPSVADFMAGFASKTDARHCLRVMSRRKLIQIKHADGSVYPVAYEPPVETAPAEGGEAPAAAPAVDTASL